MSTKIELKYPYSEVWDRGYLNINKDNRRTLSLFNSKSDRSSTQYARYLMSVKIGRFLSKDEHVDHIDNDKTNDSIDNLQILTLAENNIKTHKKPDMNLICPVCSTEFSRTRTQLSGRIDRAERNEICCCRRCGATYGALKK